MQGEKPTKKEETKMAKIDTGNVERRLTAIFSEIGMDYGFNDVSAEFSEFSEFKVEWYRDEDIAGFEVSDYIIDAPRGVLEILAKAMFSKITLNESVGYHGEFKDYVTSEDFARKNQSTYVGRNRSLTGSAQGNFKNLDDSFNRLVDAGLLEDDPTLFVSWSKKKDLYKMGTASALMRVVGISAIFDNADVPDFVLDYLMYQHCRNAIEGRRNFGESGWNGDLGKDFPRADEASGWIDKNLHRFA